MAVAKSEGISLSPILAKMAVNAANKAASKAYTHHIVIISNWRINQLQ
jgi:hypothetical protein